MPSNVVLFFRFLMSAPFKELGFVITDNSCPVKSPMLNVITRPIKHINFESTLILKSMYSMGLMKSLSSGLCSLFETQTKARHSVKGLQQLVLS